MERDRYILECDNLDNEYYCEYHPTWLMAHNSMLELKKLGYGHFAINQIYE